jgi:proteasome lid subunit RPN8/RPN11
MFTRTELLTPTVVDELSRHAMEEYPRESVGLVLADGSYLRLSNCAADPNKFAAWDTKVFDPLFIRGEIRALVHSHPNGPNCPSGADMRSQVHHDIPFIIVSTNGKACLPPFAWGDTLEPPPLLDRPFMHGVTDCYALIKDYYFLERGVMLPEFPRDWDWWLNAQNLYDDGFKSAGFNEIYEQDVRDGDVVLFQVRSDVTNHGGVVVGDCGILLHHASNREPWDNSRRSKHDVLGRWKNHATKWLRYTGAT